MLQNGVEHLRIVQASRNVAMEYVFLKYLPASQSINQQFAKIIQTVVFLDSDAAAMMDIVDIVGLWDVDQV